MYIVLDIETTGLNPWFGDEVTCICAKAVDAHRERMFAMPRRPVRSERDLLTEFDSWLRSVVRRWEDCLLVTKNGKRFDVPFLLARCVMNQRARIFDVSLMQLLRYKQYDLHEVTKKWVSLDDMASLLGVENKSGSGLQAIQLYNEGKFDELLRYCMQDVKVTEQVFLRHLELKGEKVE